MGTLREDAFAIIERSLDTVMPDMAVESALNKKKETFDRLEGRLVVISIGKAGFTMARAAQAALGTRIDDGLVVTKYGHANGVLDRFEIIEAGHPIPDINSVRAGQRALELVAGLTELDQVVFLISGGGSALFEKPADGVSIQDLTIITDQLLASGANIVEINTIRKHLSAVKGGRFAAACEATPIYAVILSDVVGDRIDSIASGPVSPDMTTSGMALEIMEKYKIFAGPHIYKALEVETPKRIGQVEFEMAGSVRRLCESAAEEAAGLGYAPVILTVSLECEAKEAGRMMGAMARDLIRNDGQHALQKPSAIILGGETTVHVTGRGLGGRNQELALAAAIELEGYEGVTVFSVGSDGTDGPTDAAGGIVDGESAAIMREEGVDPEAYLRDNNAYNALKASGDLLITGPTGTNVNDLMVILAK